ncbi:hypothetical protein [Streptomyces griseofuscus]|uniref:CsbD family protein n=1 Tax=Streptomyces griseofuscus TaxID=146922 RepID=A0A7H1PTI5_9ACTN|nr:hypothetical protein [Streptomyces griseofuscus]QNT91365.1 hypothetical protein HEP81_01031 [Streptomyces griseofuscus]BBC92241.1 hypothetical protein SRO_1065 [Streptomyces rochei]
MGESTDKAKGKAEDILDNAESKDRMTAEGRSGQSKGKAKDAAADMREKVEGMRDSFREDR